LVRKGLTDAQAKSSLSYHSGDVIQAQKSYTTLGMKRGDIARVIENNNAGRVSLELSDGSVTVWRPALQTNMKSYQVTSREFSIGDAIRFTSNDYSNGTVNGERAIVSGIEVSNQLMTITKADGCPITLEAERPIHLDYGYCSTVHSAQGQTVDRILIDSDTQSAMVNESSFYVGISRARESVTIYTDDKSMLPDAIRRSDEKSSALEIQSKEHGGQNKEVELNL